MNLRHEVIDSSPPCSRLGICLATDLTGNGRDDLVVGGMGANRNLYIDGKPTRLPNLAGIRHMLGFTETNLFWYENPGWERHEIANIPRLDVGGTTGDVDGDGDVDLVVGQGIDHTGLYWLRQPPDPREPWSEYLITDDYEKYHDIAFADVDDDGAPEVVGLSQESEVVFYYDVPDDPTSTPWPRSHRHVIAEDLKVEGVAVVDIDGDGRTELVAGPNVFHRTGDGGWEREPMATDGWEDARVAVADLDGDGDLEVVITEGDSPHLTDNPGRVAWFEQPDWERTTLRESMYCPHTVQVADFDGDGTPDIYVAEMGLDENEDPEHVVFLNDGDANFTEVEVARGIATHEAKVADLNGNDRPDIVGKSYGPDHHVDAWHH